MFTGRSEVEAETPILWPSDLLEKTLMLGKIEGRRRRERQRIRWLDGITDSMDVSLRTGRPGVLEWVAIAFSTIHCCCCCCYC